MITKGQVNRRPTTENFTHVCRTEMMFLAAKIALEATFLLVSRSKSVMRGNFRPSDST